MEKISHIVRGNARTASVDLKSSGAVRPGVPSYGRTIGESPQVTERAETTAAKVTAIQNEINDAKKGGDKDHVVEQMADAFFMSRIRRPEEELAPALPKVKVSAKKVESEAPLEEVAGELHERDEEPQPSGFTPRGSFVDVRV